MDVRLIIRPLPFWDLPETPARDRRSRSTFRASWQSTVDLLGRELSMLDAQHGVIQADFRESDLRLDGLPRSGAPMPSHPGIKVSFESKYGALTYATDSCAFWQHNVRSIGLGLEALRAVDRYGVTRHGEQYTGWLAIESGVAKMTREQAARALWELAGRPIGTEPHDAAMDLVRAQMLHRQAKARTHPDVVGNREKWDEMELAAQTLGLGA
jgi:hypothetical protein